MLERLGGAIARNRRAVLAVAAGATVLSGLTGIGIHSHLIQGGLEPPDSENLRGEQLAQERFPIAAPNLVLLVTPTQGTVDDEAVARAGVDLTRRLADEPEIAAATSYWTLGFTVLRADDRSSALILARVDSDPNDIVDRTEPIIDRYTIETDDFTVEVGGYAAVLESAARNTQRDYVRAELLAIPVVIILLLLVYRSLAAALLPAVVGGLAVLGAYPVLRISAEFTDMTVFALNIVTALGLALGIDYSLFTVSRYREELARGATPHDAVVRTVATAGRTITFSAFAVAAALGALLVFPGPFLRSFAIAGVAVVAIAGIGAVVVLPALLAVLGTRVEWGTLPFLRRRPDGRGWYRLARTVMRRPAMVTVAVVAVLIVVGLPFLRIELGVPGWRALPADDPAARAVERIDATYDSRESDSLTVILSDVDPTTELEAVVEVQERLSQIEGVRRVDGVGGFWTDGEPMELGSLIDHAPLRAAGVPDAELPGLDDYVGLFDGEDATWMRVVLTEPASATGSRAVVHEIRDLELPFGVLVAGQAAQAVDMNRAHLDRLPLALGLMGTVSFIVLFLMFGSLLVPVKAIILNVLSLTATFGALVWIFQDGNLASALDFRAEGYLYVAVPILLFCVAFGTSMDYEVFMLSRIKEEYDRTGDNEQSIAVGLQRSGRIVTAAAITFSAVMFAVGTSQLSFIKLLGIGVALAILVDAFVIRVTLLPALMKLAGAANWWAPRWLRRVHDRVGIAKAETSLHEGSSDQAESSRPERVV